MSILTCLLITPSTEWVYKKEKLTFMSSLDKDSMAKRYKKT